MRCKSGLAFVVALGLLALVMLAASPGLNAVRAQGPDAGPTPTAPGPNPDGMAPETILDYAQRTAEDASKAVESANTILGVIEGLGTLLTIILALIGVLGALIGIGGMRDFSQARRRYEDEMNKALESLKTFEARVEANAEEIRARGDRSIEALTLLQLGKQQMDARNLGAAMDALKQAWTKDPQNRAINYFMGELCIQIGDYDAAIRYLTDAGANSTDENMRLPAAQAALAYAYRKKGDQAQTRAEQQDYYYKAEGYFREALRYNPGLLDIDGESWSGALGGLYQKQGRIADAIAAYEQAIEATGRKSSYPFNNLAILHAQQRNMTRAREYFQRAVEAAARNLDDKPHDYWARFDMVTAQAFLGNADEVRKHLQLAFSTAPSADRLNVFLGGLNRLKDAAPSELLDRVIAAVQAEIERRKAELDRSG
ncbi:MAG: tetratricopeptide repeat protein [Anaerolineae bacterium]|nr:tetratricopeptide repeat protein [Anaerolineae bacterium]